MLDLRMPIACFFLINAAVLIIYGSLEPSLISVGNWQVNLNLTWGTVMGVFGAFMYWLVWRERGRSSS